MQKKVSSKVSNNKRYAIILFLVICLALLAGCQEGSKVESPINDQEELHTDTQITPVETELTNSEDSNHMTQEDSVKDQGELHADTQTTPAKAGLASREDGDNEVQEGDSSKENELFVNQMNEHSNEHSIEGFTYVDGREVPVCVTLGVESIQTGKEAYKKMQEYNADITPPDDNEEYIIVTLHISYDEGEIEELDMMENRASLAAAGLYFALSNSHSNAQDVTSYLDNIIYDIVLTKGESAQGAVAFLQEKGNAEPLVFVGFEQIVRFYINQE